MQLMATFRDQLTPIYKVNQQHKYCLAKAIYVITRRDRRIKQLLLIRPVF